MVLRTFLVVNPASANGATGRRFAQILDAVKQAVGGVEHAFTSRPLEATLLARRALEAGFECVVSVGGDGTANEVVNGFFGPDGKPLRPGAALGIIPRGTGGDFRKTFGWSADLAEAAARLATGATRAIDVGRLSFVDHQGAPASRWFLNIASAGVSGQVDFEVNRSTKALGGKVSFALGTLKAMAGWKDRRIRFALDDSAAEETAATCLAVANGQYFGGGMWVAPDASLDDGLFDLTLWSGLGLKDFAFKARTIYDGSHVRSPHTRRFQARRVRVESDEQVLLDVDGEQPGRLPASFELYPKALTLKV